MPIYVSEGESKARELIPAGMYVARCYRIIQLGTSVDERWGKEQSKVMIGFEFPDKKKVFKEGEPAKPLVKDIEYTLSLGDKATLRAHLNSWRGKAFTKEELKKFNLSNIIGAPCLINIVHEPGKTDTSKIYDKIKTITPLMEGQVCPEAINQPFEFNFDDKFSEPALEAFPDFIKDKIKASNEYKKLKGIAYPSDPEYTIPRKDDLPF